MMQLSRAMTWLLFLSLPLMTLARQFPDGTVHKGATWQVWLKISDVLTKDDLLESQGTTRRATRSSVENDNGDREAATGITNGVDARRQLQVVPLYAGGVGSRPPKCTSRCGMCSPCIPMNVPVGGAKIDDEYYPEVWRCECDGKLYMP